MMKKVVILAIICFCFSPAYAQRNFWRGLTHWKMPTAFTRNIESTVLRIGAKANSLSGPHIQITNMPGKPLVKLETDVPFQNAAILPARMLSGIESHEALFPGEGLFPPLYVPATLNTADEVVYRGLKLYNLQDLQHILRKGLEYRKVSREMEKRIYFSGTLRRAARYAVEPNSPEIELPVLVKFTVPDKERICPSPYVLGWDYYYPLSNIPASYIQDVMILLEVGGTPSWYKAVLENGELMFVPAPSRVFQENELIEHDLGIYDDY